MNVEVNGECKESYGINRLGSSLSVSVSLVKVRENTGACEDQAIIQHALLTSAKQGEFTPNSAGLCCWVILKAVNLLLFQA